ncbi:hypothetical protein L6164_033301 [Bauhinia variegata]|uniref:Uncharacterized protein n=1 Tax=Bauhinia variegata TaxID=167791 RepID=A0ACB9KRV8_BAUVA|nr:hypothetical protein L6164_033301 [Bauhinia variegata]
MFASSSAITLLHGSPRKAHFPGKKIAASFTTRENRAPRCFAPKMASPVSLYEVLGISMTADSHEIKAAYRKLARSCHPDVVAMNQKESSANEFMKIHSAYSTLSDPYKRAQYDRVIYSHRKPLNYSNLTMDGFGQAGRNWETDQCW